MPGFERRREKGAKREAETHDFDTTALHSRGAADARNAHDTSSARVALDPGRMRAGRPRTARVAATAVAAAARRRAPADDLAPKRI